MRALITAEFDRQSLLELESLGYSVTTAGWGSTRHALAEDELCSMMPGMSLLVVEVERVTPAVVAAGPQLKIVATCRSGPSNVAVDAATQAGVAVLCTPGRNADSVADFVLGLILALGRNIRRADAYLRQYGWFVGSEIPYFHFRGPELHRATLGVVGCGAIGSGVARRATALGMRVLGYDPFLCQEDVGSSSRLCGLAELLERSDFVSLHVPLDDSTRGLIGSDQIASMKSSSYLVNTARPAVVDEQALFAALEARTIAGAALDVFWTEPLPRDSRWLALDNVILTPHIGGASDQVKVHHSAMVVDDIRTLLSGARPRRQVNEPVARNQ
jgi:D-3-phosphoglycerate dehydrogenase